MKIWSILLETVGSQKGNELKQKSITIGEQKYNMTVISEEYRHKIKYIVADIACDCGSVIRATRADWNTLNRYKCGSCHCRCSIPHPTYDRIYSIWSSMKYRTRHSSGSNKCYEGIEVSAEWGNFYTFYRWSIDNGYKEGLTIDRIRTYLGYSSSNCRWADSVVQSQNRRKTGRNNTGYKGVYKRTPRAGKVLYKNTFKTPYYLIIIYKGKRMQQSGFATALEAHEARLNFIKENYDGLIYPD